MKQDARKKIQQTERFVLMLWTVFLIILYVCSFLAEYHPPNESEEMVAKEIILNDLQKLCFFALMGLGFLIDIIRMQENRNNAFVFLLLTLFLGGFSGGIGAMQAQFIFHITRGG